MYENRRVGSWHYPGMDLAYKQSKYRCCNYFHATDDCFYWKANLLWTKALLICPALQLPHLEWQLFCTPDITECSTIEPPLICITCGFVFRSGSQGKDKSSSLFSVTDRRLIRGWKSINILFQTPCSQSWPVIFSVIYSFKSIPFMWS